MKKLSIIMMLLAFTFVGYTQTNNTASDTSKLSELFIKKLLLPHCAKGADKCDECKKAVAQGERYYLIRVYYVSAGEMSRPMTMVNNNGVKKLYEFDVENIFDNAEAAMVYSRQNKVTVLPADQK